MTTISSGLSILSQQTNSLSDCLSGQSDESSSVDSTVALLTQKAKIAQNKTVTTYGGTSSSAGKAALQKALKELSEEKNGSITYNDIKKYQQDLELEFSVMLRVGVAQKGVAPDQPFSLKLDPNGKVSVECEDSTSKATIEKYLKDNESVAQKFAYIQALSNLERARQVNGATNFNYNTESAAIDYQSAFVESFFSDSLDTNFNIASTKAEFKGIQENTNFYTGLNISV